MYISQEGLNLIKEFEGCILSAYDDYNDNIVTNANQVRGTLTIGYGHIEGVYVGQTISQDKAEEMLKDDMVRYCQQTQSVLDSINVPFPITQNVFDALVSFEYNLGQGNLRTLLANGNRDKQTVADMMLEYRNKGSQWEAGLLRRRRAERDMFLGSGNSTPVQVNISGNEVIRQLQHQVNVQGFGNIAEDGIFGEETLSHLPVVRKGANGEITKWIQSRIGVNVDGDFGNATEEGVRFIQRKYKLSDDGVVGRNTWSKLCQYEV